VHRSVRQLTSISSARIERRHAAASPTKDRFQLRDRRAGICSACCGNLTQSMRRSVHAGCTTGFAKLVPERAFIERMTIGANDKV
jgi:hypothetical protein